MFNIFTSALFGILRFLFTGTFLKFTIMGVLYFVITTIVPWAIEAAMPEVVKNATSGLTSGFAAIPDSMYFFLQVFEVPFGAGLLFAAYAGRFILRRIPLIG
jgi:hypothetical protein